MKVFAHRGMSALFPENSRSAINACDGQLFAGIEVDVFQVENEFFILHDRWLVRLFGIDKHIDDLSAEEVRNLRCKDGQLVPTLEWIIQRLVNNQLELNLELKKITNIDFFLARLTLLCNQYNVDLDRILLSSFNHPYLQAIAQKQPELRLGMLLSAHPINIDNLCNEFPLYSVNIDISCLSAELIAQIHRNGLKAYVFTVDHQKDIQWLKACNADAIFANDPNQAFKFVNFSS